MTPDTEAERRDVESSEGSSVKRNEERSLRLEKIVRNHVTVASGIGLVALPVVDMVGLLAVELNQIRQLSKEYGVPFDLKVGKTVVLSLIGSIGPVGAGVVFSSLIKCVPLIGSATGALSVPLLAGSITYAINKVFVRHFESGGSFKDINLGKAKQYFAEQFIIGKKVVASMSSDKEPAPAT